jgi:CPA1 family monovalent cation:H+ antiporter
MVPASDAYSRLRLLMLDSERSAVMEAQREGRYENSVIDAVLGDFDSIETALKRSYRRDIMKPAREPFRLGRRRAS